MKAYLAFFALPILLVSCQSQETSPAPDTNAEAAQQSESALKNSYQGPDATRLSEGIQFFATGNEPFWSFEVLTDKMLRFKMIDGTGINTPYVEPEITLNPKVLRYKAEVESGNLEVEITLQKCENNMSGEAFPYVVKVTTNGKTYSGCGRFTADERIHGRAWKLRAINGDEVKDEQTMRPVSIQFDREKAMVYGQDGCNGFFGPGEVRGHRAFMGPNLAGTLMACPEMHLGDRFKKAIGFEKGLEIGFRDKELILRSDSIELRFEEFVESSEKRD